MDAYAEDGSQLNHSPAESELGLSSSSMSRLNDEEEALIIIDKFKNADLNSDSIDRKAVLDVDYTEPFGSGGAYMLPLRPDAGDCAYYLRTGGCKFGKTCRYNHPVSKTDQVVKDTYQSSGNDTKAECKYYLRAGGCKYGTFCKFTHSKKQADTKFNTLGLPLRLEEKECGYYMRYGSCGYGAECVFHHPEPTFTGGYDTLDPSLEDGSMIKSDYSFGNSNSKSPTIPSDASQPIQRCWISHPSSCKTSVYQNDNSSDESVSSYPQGTKKNSEWNVPQVPSSTVPHLTTEENTADIMPEQSLPSPKVEGSPELPSQTLCSYLLKNGDCMFKSSCRFYHPENWVPMTSGRVLNDKGLPLRPDREVCRHYRHFGICKYGSICMFDHPINLALAPVTNTHHAQIVIGDDSDF